MRTLYYFIFLPIFLISSCSFQKTNTDKADLPILFHDEAEMLHKTNKTVHKEIQLPQIEKKTIKSINWKNELVLFQEFEEIYNKNKHLYTKEEKDSANHLVVRFITAEEKLKVKKATYILYKNQVSKVIFLRAYKDNISTHRQELIYEPEIGYSVKGFQSIKGINSLEFKIEAFFVQDNLWSGGLILGLDTLPFKFIYNQSKFIFINGKEQLSSGEVVKKGDSIFVDIAVFDSELKATYSDTLIQGAWYNYYKGKDYFIPFYVYKDVAIKELSVNPINVAGKWEVTFSPDADNSYPAIGIFEQENETVFGTFLTETGDYRYLEGYVKGNNLVLSCFDGAHAFLFKATLSEQNELSGIFYSGKHWQEPWEAKRNEKAELQDPTKLTYMKNPNEKFNFSFPNLLGKQVSLDDPSYHKKVVIVQILGSWCPNCMDESLFLNQLYQKYQSRGLEIVGLCFEKSEEFELASKTAQKLKDDLDVNYELLIAGKASKTSAAEKLPMLNHIMSYPTTIYIDKTGKVARIHTGFYGPGTGTYYESFVNETERFVEKLLQE
jgi:thiol-disulfide isomerase/thioredoxin